MGVLKTFLYSATFCTALLTLVACNKSGPAGPNLVAVSPAMSGGVGHTCALNTKGLLNCWGLNNNGQTGSIESNVETFLAKPFAVLGFKTVDQTSDKNLIAEQIAATRLSTCLMTRSGLVKCWGWNGVGQLGNQSNTTSLTAVSVQGLSAAAVQLTAGDGHTCVVLITGDVQCWGYNGSGQLGNGTFVSASSAVQAQGISGATSVAAGLHHTCVVVNGGVKCWGANDFGQLGNGTRIAQTSAVDVTGLTTGVEKVFAGGDHSCALISATGAVKCWGRNDLGQLGKGQTTIDERTAVDVTGITTAVTSLSLGSAHTCALAGGSLRCWGANTFGQLGTGLFSDASVPTAVTGLDTGVLSVGTGTNHTCAFLSSGGFQCWGANNFGQLGDGTTKNRIAPQTVEF